MYRPRNFAIDDLKTLHAAIRTRVFVTLAIVHEGRIVFAYAPTILDVGEAGSMGTIRFHLAKANPVAAHAGGAELFISMAGADAYVSPDWYESVGMVPTRNYVAIEGSGIARKLDRVGLQALLVDLSAQEEKKLAGKKPWTLDKVPEKSLAAKLEAIDGFSLKFETLRGKFKLSQDKNPADFTGVVRGLEEQGAAGSSALAATMRQQRE